MYSEEVSRADCDRLVEVLNGLSNDAYYIASQGYFTETIMGRTVAMQPSNERNRAALWELHAARLVILESDGFRASPDGMKAGAVIVAIEKKRAER